MMSSLHWGEVAGQSRKMRGKAGMDLVLSRLSAFGIGVIPVDGHQALGAALFKLKRQIPYVDAFGIELTAKAPERVFVTADFDFKPASRDVKIEFLPAK
jgi:hypothetical protein